ncbi:endonuclease III [Halobacteriales archaeon QH_6_64_20]|nr:MAG: endonuclease III [Halobacteriales archaeon QH_6_64_20]
MAEEPAENVGGGAAGGGRGIEFESEETHTCIETVIDRLGELYWQKSYGGRDAFECLVRTVLSQNTSDKASQPAHDNLMRRYADDGGDGDGDGNASVGGTVDGGEGNEAHGDGDSATESDLAASLAAADQPELAETISNAGLYNQKSETIIALAERIVSEHGGAAGFDAFVREAEYNAVRDALLDMNGVGPKTADCVLLFSGGRGGVFPVDTHVHRIYRRLGIAPADADHEAVRDVLEERVPAAKCGFGHTASIQFGREYCKARKPACLDDPDACPLGDVCEQVGVYPDSGEAVDPAEAPGAGD